jgi:hypothetical protein
MQLELEIIKRINLQVIRSTELLRPEIVNILDSINLLQSTVEQKLH